MDTATSYQYIEEIQSDPTGMSGAVVRVLGKLLLSFPLLNLAIFEWNNFKLIVDTELLGNQQLQTKSLYMLIGDLELFDKVPDNWRSSILSIINELKFGHGKGLVKLKVNILNDMDGLDVDLFQKALEIRREFLKSR